MSTAMLLPTAEMPPGPVSRFTVEQYHRMIDTGVLNEDSRVELIEGWILPKMPRSPRHCATTERLERQIRALLPAGWYVRSEKPITTRDSEPEPDIAVARGDADEYEDRHPGPKDLALVVEVARTSLMIDLRFKIRLYARAGIAEYWVANAARQWIAVFSDPASRAKEPNYRSRREYTVGQTIHLWVGGRKQGEVDLSVIFPAKAR